MSEEQPTFKVKDRRLFNPDGTPREIERDEETNKTTTNAAAAAAGDSTATAASSAESAKAGESGGSSSSAAVEQSRSTETAAPERAPSSTPPGEDLQEDLYAEGEVPGANDPASFINFLMSIASNAAAALGMMEHPVTGERGVDLALGKHWIDVLGMLQQKTRGNLARQEEQIFEGLLSDLRMQFVSLTNAAPPGAGGRTGLTGRDIIGGK